MSTQQDLENISNVGIIHSECAENRLKGWQSKHTHKKLNLTGMYAKAKFTDGKDSEHMWIIVKSDDGVKVTGILDNDPFILSNYRCGQQVTVDRNLIEQHA